MVDVALNKKFEAFERVTDNRHSLEVFRLG